MHFDEQAVGTHRHSGAGQGNDHIVAARGVARIDEHRQVRLFLRNGDGAQVERVAAGVLEGADASFAENDPIVAVHTDVLGGEQPFVNQSRDAALEQDGLALGCGGRQHRNVLGVARTNLENIGAFGDHLVVLGRHHFRNDGQPRGRAGLVQ